MKFVVSIISLLCAVSFLVASYSFYEGHEVYCQGRDTTLNVLRDLLVDAQAGSPNTEASRAFFAKEHSRIDQARC